MIKLKSFNSRLRYSFIGGVVCAGVFKLYIYVTNREQSNDSNLLVSIVLTLISTVFIYLLLKLLAIFVSPKDKR